MSVEWKLFGSFQGVAENQKSQSASSYQGGGWCVLGRGTKAAVRCLAVEAVSNLPPLISTIAMRRSDFPYIVEVAAHVRGQQAMYDFHARQGIRAQPAQGKHKDGRRYIRWRFASLTDAEKFARQFGGSLVAGP